MECNFLLEGFVFVADEGIPVVWRLNSNGDLITEKTLNIEGMGQVAKIRKDATSGFVACSTAWGVLSGNDRFVMALVKLDSSLNVEWSQVIKWKLNPTFVINTPSDPWGCWGRDPGV